jgi:hypothetical protein
MFGEKNCVVDGFLCESSHQAKKTISFVIKAKCMHLNIHMTFIDICWVLGMIHETKRTI